MSFLACNCDFSKLDPFFEENYENPGDLIFVLQTAQDFFGYLSEPLIHCISGKTGIKCSKIYGVVTFYTQFRLRPAGEYEILLCKGTACHVAGVDAIGTAIKENFGISDGEMTADGLFSLRNVACLGCCSLAPVMMVRDLKKKETFGNLTPAKACDILRDIQKNWRK